MGGSLGLLGFGITSRFIWGSSESVKENLLKIYNEQIKIIKYVPLNIINYLNKNGIDINYFHIGYDNLDNNYNKKLNMIEHLEYYKNNKNKYNKPKLNKGMASKVMNISTFGDPKTD